MNIEIITSTDFRENDLKDIKNSFTTYGFDIQIDNKRMIRESLDLSPEIWVYVIIPTSFWITKQFFSGFFNRMGEDAYDNLKKILLDLWAKKKNDRQIRSRLFVKDENEKRIIIALPENTEKIVRNTSEIFR